MDLTETFDLLDLAQIDDYLTRRQEEYLHLDFKTIKGASLASADDRRSFAKSLSGFANSAGGIIVWGVDARKNDQGVDCAGATSEIKQLKMLLSRLNEFTGQAVSPIVDGVRHKLIERTTDTGFAATLVPESQSAPHMAKLGEDRYYKRSGASFYKMEHFDLEDMFGRRQKPSLEIIFQEGKKEEGVEELIILLVNQGRAVARHAGFVMTFQPNLEIVEVGPEMRNNSGINAGRPVVSFDKETGVIHPNGIRVSLGSIRVRRKDPTQPIQGEVTVYCEGTQNVKRLLSVAPIPPSAAIEEAPKAKET
jgi:Putative DNA-binding domain